MMKTPLMTIFGGSGFVGSAVARYLCSTGGYRVRVADLRNPRELPPEKKSAS